MQFILGFALQTKESASLYPIGLIKMSADKFKLFLSFILNLLQNEANTYGLTIFLFVCCG